jgi:N-hydroxyarylamine O-acetyltransferase
MTWDVSNFNLPAYLERIGGTRTDASLETLYDLHRAHVRAIPFENVDVVLGTHPGIGFDAIQSKLVGRQRGGYCYEHALLFAAALEHLGFDVTRRVARVQPQRPGPRTHALLKVRIDEQEYLADVGFGAGMLHPMPLKDGAVVDQAGWDHRLTAAGDLWTLEKKTKDGWVPQHASDDEPQLLIDYQIYHHYVSTHPNSPFSTKIVVMRLDDGISRRLVGNQFTTEYADGRLEQYDVPDEEVGDALADLDVVLTAEELDRLQHVLAASRP